MNIYLIAKIVLAIFALWILYLACSAFVIGYRNSRLKPGETSIGGPAISTGGKPVDGNIVKGCFQIGGLFLILGLGFATPLILEVAKGYILKAHMEKFEFQDVKTASILIESLGEQDLSFFQVYKLSETDHVRSVDLFLSVLNDEDRERDLAALSALVQINHPSAIKPVMEILDRRRDPEIVTDLDPYADLVASLVNRLGTIGERTLFEYVEARKVRRAPYFVGKVLARLESERAYEALVDMTTAGMEKGHRSMVWILGDSKRTEARDWLITLANSKQQEFRWYAIQGLSKFQDQVALEALLNLSLTESNPTLLSAVTRGLSLHDGATVLPAFLTLLKHSDPGVRRGAIASIRNIGNVDATKHIVPYLVDWQISKAVASSLEDFGWVASSQKEKVRLWVAKKDRGKLEADWQTAKEVLLSDLASSDKLAVENSVYAFIGLGKEKFIGLLEEQLEKKGNKIMAEVYLNSGNRSLYQYSKKWAQKRGYQIQRGDGARFASWGSWK